MISVYLTLFFPLIGALVGVLLTKAVPQNLRVLIPVVGMILSVLASGPMFLEFLDRPFTKTFLLFDWIALGQFHIAWSLYLDTTSLIMIFVILLVSLPVHIYSLGYMANDPKKARFMNLLSLFTFMMLFLVMAGTTVQLFVGWEGIGLCSYLLIGFWSEKDGPRRASLKALLMNRWGDVLLLLAFVGIFWLYGTFSFDGLKAAIAHPLEGEKTLSLCVALCLLGAAVVKSAQIGFHTWLQDAMEGPTPVSALIHAATLVTAGIFLLLRFSDFLETVPYVLDTAILLGAGTAVFGGIMALLTRDLKRIIAYSTCSQLGYMMTAVGLKSHSAALFHLMTHAFFKSLLFLGAGALIFMMKGEKDITRMGFSGRWPLVPYASMLVGVLSLTGMPFFAGFFSKEFIFEFLWHHQSTVSLTALGLLGVATFLTGLYSLRFFLRVFHGESSRKTIETLGYIWQGPLVFLMIMSVLIGYLGKTILGYHLLFLPDPLSMLTSFSLLTVAVGLLGMGLGGWVYRPSSKVFEDIKSKIPSLYHAFVQYGSGDFFYSGVCVREFRKRTIEALKIDTLLDSWGPLGLSRGAAFLHTWIKKVQTGYLYHYVSWMLLGLVLILAYGIWKVH